MWLYESKNKIYLLSYFSLRETEFKALYYNHVQSFRHRLKTNTTELSYGTAETPATNLKSHGALFATQSHINKKSNNVSYSMLGQKILYP